MILTLNETKEFLRLEQDCTFEDTFITSLIISAESYIKNATGKTFDNTNELAKLAFKMLISHWYSHREIIGKADKLAYSLDSILFQLKYCYEEVT
jgi:uncharacterized phage protein (predicted DNA packaging)